MTKHIWSLQKIAFGVESTAGTWVAASDPMPKRSGVFQSVTVVNKEVASFGTIDESHAHHVDYEYGALDNLVTPVGHKTIGYQLLATFGQQFTGIKVALTSVVWTFTIWETVTWGTSSATGEVMRTNNSNYMVIKVLTWTFTAGWETITGWSSSATASASYDNALRSHIFTRLNTNNHKSLSIWWVDPNQTIRWAYGMIDQLSIDYTNEWELKATSSWKTKKPTSESEPSLTFLSETIFRGKDVKIYLADTEIGLESATAIEVENMNLNFVKNLFMFPQNGDISFYCNQQFSVGGSFTGVFDATTLKWYVQAWTYKYMKIAIIATGATIWSASNPELVIIAARVWFMSHNKSDANNDVVKETLDFTFHHNSSAGYICKADLLNEETSDY